MSEEAYIGECIHYRQITGISADNMHIGRYIVQSADDRIYADYLQYRIGRISVSANFPNLDIVCTLRAHRLHTWHQMEEHIQGLLSRKIEMILICQPGYRMLFFACQHGDGETQLRSS